MWLGREHAGILVFGTFRHKYRTLLSLEGTPLDVQQKLLRHADIRTTTQYGDVPEENKRKANSDVVRTILSRKSAQSPLKTRIGRSNAPDSVGLNFRVEVRKWLRGQDYVPSIQAPDRISAPPKGSSIIESCRLGLLVWFSN